MVLKIVLQSFECVVPLLKNKINQHKVIRMLAKQSYLKSIKSKKQFPNCSKREKKLWQRKF